MAEITKRRAVREGTVDKSDFFELLKDRRWHPLAEILYNLKNKVSPEIASQYFIKHGNSKNRRRAAEDGETKEVESTASHAEKVNRGRRIFIRKRLNDSADHGFIRKRKNGTGDDDWEYSWGQWHCWSCGALSEEDVSHDKLCDGCRGSGVSSPGVSVIDRLATTVEEARIEIKGLIAERDAAVLKARAIRLAAEG